MSMRMSVLIRMIGWRGRGRWSSWGGEMKMGVGNGVGLTVWFGGKL